MHCAFSSVFAATEVRFPNRSRDYLEEGNAFQVVFDKAVVTDKTVGKPAEPGFLAIAPEMKLTSKWVAPNVLECTPSAPVPFRASYTCSPADGALFQDGSAIPQKAFELKGRQDFWFRTYLMEHSYGHEVYPWEGVFVVLPFCVPGEEALLQKAWFMTEPDKDRRKAGIVARSVPAVVRAATLKEVRQAVSSSVRNRGDESEFRGKPDDMAVPGVYVVRPKEDFQPGAPYVLVVPDARSEGREPQDRQSRREVGEVPSFSADVSYSRESATDGRLTIEWTLPVKIDDVEQFFKEHAVFKFGDGGSNAPALEYDDKAGGFTGVVQNPVTKKNQTVVICLDRERLTEMKHRRPNWYDSLPLLVCGDEPVFKLDWKLDRVRSVSGLALADKSASGSVDVKPDSPSLYLDAGNNGIMAAGARRLKVSCGNLKDLIVRGYRIRDDHRHQTFTAYRKIYERNQSAPLQRTVTDRDDRHFLPTELLCADGRGTLPVDVRGKTGVDVGLDAIFGTKVEPGMYFIEVEGRVSDSVLAAYKMFGVTMNDDSKREFDGDQASFAAQAVVQVTNMGVLHKKTQDELFLYVYSLSTGKALPQAEVQLLDDAGALVTQTKTEANGAVGTCRLPLNKAAAYVRVIDGKDSYLTSLSDEAGKIGLYSFDVETLPYVWRELGLSPAATAENRVFMFTDRSLYRPAETMHLKGIVRELKANRLGLAPVESILLTVADNRDREILVREVKPSDAGTFDLDVTFPEGKTGTYYVQASLKLKGDAAPADEDGADDEESEYGSQAYYRKEFERSNREFRHEVEVAEFKRNEFEVESSIHKLTPGDTALKADVKAVNFTGAPVSGGKVHWALRISNVNFYPADFRDYRFGNYLDGDSGYWEAYYGYSFYGGSSSDMKQQIGVLDGKGKQAVEFAMDGQNFPRVRNLTLTSSITNGNEQTIKDAQRAVWYPSSVFVGVRNASSISRQGKPLDLKLIAVGLDGKPYAGGDLMVKMTVTRTAFLPSRYEGGDNTTVRNEQEKSVVAEESVVITPADSAHVQQGGKAVTAPTPKDGIYEVVLSGRDAQGKEFRTADKYWVYGSDTSPWEYHDGLNVKIIPDKQLYKPGETARLLVQTPIEGDVVVTVEREKVLRSFTRHMTLGNPVVEIPLEDGDAPNVYVSVFLVKGAELSGRRVKNPQLKLGYAALKVQPLRNTLQVQVNAPAGMSLPGSTATVGGVVTDHQGRPVRNAEVCLYAEDEGTLQVIGYETPQPLNYFYADRPLAVDTWTTLEQILEEDLDKRATDNKGMFVGGGGDGRGDSLLFKKREDFNPCAVWLASVRTDDQGRFKAGYVNPDTLTRYRVMAVAVAGEADFGSGESSYVVNKPVMLEPAPPFSATVGDSLNIPVTVSQTGTRKGAWVVTLKANDVAEIPQPSQTLTLEGNQPRTLVFNVKFLKTGDARLQWEIRAADDRGVAYESGVYALLRDSVVHAFEVVPPFPDLRERRCFSLSHGKTLDLPRLMETPFVAGTPIEVTLGTSPLIYAGGSVNYLLRYPYGCLEQLSSSTLPWVYEPLLARYLPGFKGKTVQARERALNAGIHKILNNQLPGGGLSYWQGSREVSEYCPYAALVLTLARDNGAHVPEAELNSLYDYLVRDLSVQDRNEILGAWALARAGRLPESLLNTLLARSRSLDAENRLYLAMAVALSRRSDAAAVAGRLMQEADAADGRVAMLKALVELTLKPGDQAVRERLSQVIVDRISLSFGERALYSTWSSGWDMILLGEYLKGLTGNLAQAAFRVEGTPRVADGHCSINAPASFRAETGKQAVLSLPDAGATVYGVAEAHGRGRTQEDGAAVDKGFGVSRVYEKLGPDGKWKPAAEFVVGDLVRITLHVTKKAGDLHYVVMEDYLPSAFEAVNPALLSQIPGGLENESAASEDRWFYWTPWVSNREYLKDRVRFFADSWYNDAFVARYLARVTKSGSVVAPSAKAELMYKPETYGLSIPQKLNVSPRP